MRTNEFENSERGRAFKWYMGVGTKSGGPELTVEVSACGILIQFLVPLSYRSLLPPVV